MSTDYNVACRKCKVTHHFGQVMAGQFSVGWGSGDKEGANTIMKFLDKHMFHDKDILNVFINESENIPNIYQDVTKSPIR